MRTRVLFSSRREGGVLLTTLVTALLIGIVLGSYLTLLHHQNATVMRSQGWNAALAAAEAGVEEALAQLNPGTVNISIDRRANGWWLDGGSYVAPGERLLPNGSYEVRFTDARNPVIYATGHIEIPALKASIQRMVQVGTTPAPLFSVAMAALSNIDMQGNAIRSDSYNSINGPYNASNARANGDLASIGGIVNVRNAIIRGDLLTGPAGEASVNTVGQNGMVGDMNWPGPGIQTNHYANDFNVDFPTAGLPVRHWLIPRQEQTKQTIDDVAYEYVFLGSGGDFKITKLSSGSIYVGPEANVNLWISADVYAKHGGGNRILIEKGGKLTIYMGGNRFQPGDDIINVSGNPLSFTYYGLPSNTSVELTGNGSFCGTLYAPSAHLKMTGSGHFFGASVSKTVTMTGNYQLHYDEALSTLGPIRGYVATSWREL